MRAIGESRPNMSNAIHRTNPELLLKLNHLRGAISELMLRNGPRMQQLRQNGTDAVLAEEIANHHQELSARFAELEIVLDGLRRRGEEEAQLEQEELGTGRLQIEAERFDVRDLEAIVSGLRRAYEVILFAKAPALPLDRIHRLEDFSLIVHLTRQAGALTFHLKSPQLESHYVPTLIDVARAIGMGEKPPTGDKQVPLGWGPALIQVRRMMDRTMARGETLPERLQESLESIAGQLDDQLSGLADPASLGLPLGSLRTVAELLSELVLDVKERRHVQVLRLSSPYDVIYLLDEIGREPRGPDGAPQRDVAREKVDRFVQIPKKEP
jgi:hypothetical protein